MRQASIRYLVIVFGLTLIISSITFCKKGEVADAPQQNKDTTKPNEDAIAVIKGKIIDPEGKAVPGVHVSCWRVDKNDFPWEEERTKTDSRGQYQFEISFETICFIEAGGRICTVTVSERFEVKPGKIYQVENLIVYPASNSCKGRVVFEDGRPAANLTYGHISANFSSGLRNPPKTNNKGEFIIEHLLPDELFSFWIFPKENTLSVWKRLDPNSKNLEFTLKTSEYIELPEDWYKYGTHRAIARNMTYVKDSKIQFSLPDLQGNIISLQDQRFKNKAVLVNICGSWCGGCRSEIPYLVKFKNKYQKEGLEIIGIAFERGTKEEQLQAVKKITTEFNVNYPLLVGGIEKRTNVETVIKGLELFKGYPTTLYIDRKGLVKHIQGGFFSFTEAHRKWQLKQMEDNIKLILGTPVN